MQLRARAKAQRGDALTAKEIASPKTAHRKEEREEKGERVKETPRAKEEGHGKAKTQRAKEKDTAKGPAIHAVGRISLESARKDEAGERRSPVWPELASREIIR